MPDIPAEITFTIRHSLPVLYSPDHDAVCHDYSTSYCKVYLGTIKLFVKLYCSLYRPEVLLPAGSLLKENCILNFFQVCQHPSHQFPSQCMDGKPILKPRKALKQTEIQSPCSKVVSLSLTDSWFYTYCAFFSLLYMMIFWKDVNNLDFMHAGRKWNSMPNFKQSPLSKNVSKWYN